ncbi:hypothetical protein Barb6_03397 [Bacteroidales bacterium Barb6]|nr:hypothetical protein Barb6_03397 [Bacteroidales bacterium Barb6]
MSNLLNNLSVLQLSFYLSLLLLCYTPLVYTRHSAWQLAVHIPAYCDLRSPFVSSKSIIQKKVSSPIQPPGAALPYCAWAFSDIFRFLLFGSFIHRTVYEGAYSLMLLQRYSECLFGVTVFAIGHVGQPIPA